MSCYPRDRPKWQAVRTREFDYLKKDLERLEEYLDEYVRFAQPEMVSDKEVDKLWVKSVDALLQAIKLDLTIASEVAFSEEPGKGLEVDKDMLLEYLQFSDELLKMTKDVASAETRADKALAIEKVVSATHKGGARVLSLGYNIVAEDNVDKAVIDILNCLASKEENGN